MPNYMSKSEIAATLADEGYGGKQQITNILNGLAELAEREVAAGYDFVVPGIAKIKWSYRRPAAKGSRWKKGDEVNSFGNVVVKETDSPAVKAHASLKANPFGKVAKLRVSASEMSAFLRSKTGKAIASR